ncbi:MAG: chloride channel protein [Caldilineaceae bacterium]|nr:chloride channel protein [Caldilineaceae bacterium]
MSVGRRTLDYRTEPGIYPSSNFRLLFVSLLAALIGILAGLLAYALYVLIAVLSNLIFYQRVGLEIPSLAEHTLGAWILIVPAIGGLLIGLMIRYGTPKISGHGIPEAMEAVLTQRSRVSPRVAIFKPISAAIAIGTGGPFGAEGPIIQTGGALGSILGQLLHTTAAERKVLLACGAAAGMAATFSTPIAAVILAIELLLFEYKSRSFIPLVIASTLATTVHFQIVGRGPMFSVGQLDFGIPYNMPYYLILGILCGLVAVGFSNSLYWVEDQFEKLPVSSFWWPAIGGLALGIIGYFFPTVLGVGYDLIEGLLTNRFSLSVLLMIAIFKTLALLISLGSGTSGGLLAPMFIIGAALGALFATLINQIIPGANLSPGAFALVAMAAIFGSASRATFTFIIFAFEITRDYNAILPLMLVSVIADGVALKFMRNSIMTEKLARRGLRVHQDYETDVLNDVNVGSVMDRHPTIVSSQMTVSELADRIARNEPQYTRHQALLILDENDELTGLITRGDIVEALQDGLNANRRVLEAGTDNLVVTYPDETIHDALNKMQRNDIGRLPVVDRHNPRKLVGYLGRAALLEARLHRLDEEAVMEPGWLHKMTQSAKEVVFPR